MERFGQFLIANPPFGTDGFHTPARATSEVDAVSLEDLGATIVFGREFTDHSLCKVEGVFLSRLGG